MPVRDTHTEVEWLTVTQAAERSGLSTSTILRYARNGTLSAVFTPGGHRRFRAVDVDALLKAQPMTAIALQEWLAGNGKAAS